MPRLGYKIPVLSITIKPSVHLHNLAKREKADSQMRDRFRELGCPDLPVAKLYVICTMGTSFAVYEYTQETNRVSPPSISRDPDVLNDVAPSARWEYELLEADGEAKFRSIVAEVKAMAEDIEYCEPFSTRLLWPQILNNDSRIVIVLRSITEVKTCGIQGVEKERSLRDK
jgi:hypothetical protein